jgi:hypothetical protein
MPYLAQRCLCLLIWTNTEGSLGDQMTLAMEESVRHLADEPVPDVAVIYGKNI